MSIKRVLIANRGEIVNRIIATCHDLGIETVSIYTKEDQFSPYIFSSTVAFPLSRDGTAGYLDQEEIINIARVSGAKAIAPGYGFLAENASFAQKVKNAGLTWIGPSPEAIAQMGNKANAISLMKKARVPTLPSIVCSGSSPEEAHTAAKQIGYPLLLKASLGGGGKAMRMVSCEEDFVASFRLVTSEAKNLFSSDEIVIETFLPQARHVEVQIVGDGQNFIHLFERECSIQRRHQKIIEEAPCHFISQNTREAMYEAALIAARTIAYDSVGTVEFLVTPDEKFYFLEMNTRLQVEHGVTEMCTGIDLVALQLELAQTKKLRLSQSDISLRGHALQCRIYAENPQENFTPSCGTIELLSLPQGPFIRHDHDLEEGKEITAHFDPMLSKIITYGENRSQALARMKSALSRYAICGLETNISYLQAILSHDAFTAGWLHTCFLIEHSIARILTPETRNKTELLAAAATILAKHARSSQTNTLQHVGNKTAWRSQRWR